MKQSNIVLIGFPGTGKTTVGKILANRLGWQQIDTDQQIEEQEGMSIPDLFNSRGEAYFRQVESDLVRIIMEQSGKVVATGGGAVLAEPNRRSMLNGGFVVALTADVETIIKRVKSERNRPLLQGNVEERVANLVEQRKFAYDFADMKMDTSNVTIDEIIESILQKRKEALR